MFFYTSRVRLRRQLCPGLLRFSDLNLRGGRLLKARDNSQFGPSFADKPDGRREPAKHMQLQIVRAALIWWAFLVSFYCGAQDVKEGSGFVLSCGDRVAVAAGATSISSISLSSGATIWKAMPEKIVDVGPVVAGNAVAVVTDSFHTIDAFSKT